MLREHLVPAEESLCIELCGGGPLGFAWLLDSETCLQCLFGSREKLGLGHEKIQEILAKYRGSRTRVFVETYRVLRVDGMDPLRSAKQKLNNQALGALEELAPRILEEQDLLNVLGAAALANSVDIWLPGRSETGLVLEGRVRFVNAERARRILGNAGLVAYLLDNSGEAVVDIVAALRLAMEGKEVVLVARGEPYELDVTAEEAQRLLVEVARRLRMSTKRVRVVSTGSAYPGFATGLVSSKVAYLLVDADAVVSKGIANYEALVEYCSTVPEKTIVALRAKCAPIARILGAERDEAVVAAGYRCMRP